MTLNISDRDEADLMFHQNGLLKTEIEIKDREIAALKSFIEGIAKNINAMLGAEK